MVCISSKASSSAATSGDSHLTGHNGRKHICYGLFSRCYALYSTFFINNQYIIENILFLNYVLLIVHSILYISELNIESKVKTENIKS